MLAQLAGFSVIAVMLLVLPTSELKHQNQLIVLSRHGQPLIRASQEKKEKTHNLHPVPDSFRKGRQGKQHHKLLFPFRVTFRGAITSLHTSLSTALTKRL